MYGALLFEPGSLDIFHSHDTRLVSPVSSRGHHVLHLPSLLKPHTGPYWKAQLTLISTPQCLGSLLKIDVLPSDRDRIFT